MPRLPLGSVRAHLNTVSTQVSKHALEVTGEVVVFLVSPHNLLAHMAFKAAWHAGCHVAVHLQRSPVAQRVARTSIITGWLAVAEGVAYRATQSKEYGAPECRRARHDRPPIVVKRDI